jgi:hypothetical protein
MPGFLKAIHDPSLDVRHVGADGVFDEGKP